MPVAALRNHAHCHTPFLILTPYTDYYPEQPQLTGLYNERGTHSL
jgi:hypothetical protein